MNKISYDPELELNVNTFDNLEEAAEELAAQQHEVDVVQGQARTNAWEDDSYRERMVESARRLLDEFGHSDRPVLVHHSLIKVGPLEEEPVDLLEVPEENPEEGIFDVNDDEEDQDAT